jgi:hypothetical protein
MIVGGHQNLPRDGHEASVKTITEIGQVRWSWRR